MTKGACVASASRTACSSHVLPTKPCGHIVSEMKRTCRGSRRAVVAAVAAAAAVAAVAAAATAAIAPATAVAAMGGRGVS